jgi:isocitrate dehydrogenase
MVWLSNQDRTSSVPQIWNSNKEEHVTATTPITVAYGDGIGPEIMEATLFILKEAGAQLDIEVVEVGEKVYLSGKSSGVADNVWDSLRRTKVFLKAPLTTPQGGGYKSVNVTLRKTLGLYANVRPVASYHPFVGTKHPMMNLVIIRENEEDLYAGIEHRQTDEVYQTLKLMTRPGSERIIRYAFEYARLNGRKLVDCFTKDNIMKLTDGMFHKVFERVSGEYPDIKSRHSIIDIGAARMAALPEEFDVVVVPNLYGDILSDVAAFLTGSVGLGGSANVGDNVAMFEAVHGSAPDIAGEGIANPSGLLLGAVLMLVHIGQEEVAEGVHNAWLRTLEDGVHTGDIYKRDLSERRVNTEEFSRSVVARLGMQPEILRPVSYSAGLRMPQKIEVAPTVEDKKELMGCDVFLHHKDRDPVKLGEALAKLSENGLKFIMMTNRGVKVWPDPNPETFCTDHWRCRFEADEPCTPMQVVDLLRRCVEAGYDVIKTENLYRFNGEPKYSMGQGQ